MGQYIFFDELSHQLILGFSSVAVMGDVGFALFNRS